MSDGHIPVDRLKHHDYPEGMNEIADTLDANGLLCPLPVLKARKRLQPLAPGAVLKVIADDPAAIIDMPHVCAEAGHALISQEEQDGQQVYLIRKGG